MVEKKKTTKTKKKVDKKKVDKKKIKKVLKKKQKKMPKREFKKLAKTVKSKLEERTKGGQALQNVLSKTRQSIPQIPIFNPQVAAKDIKERLQTDTKKEFAKPIKDFKNMKKKYEEVLMKYNNGELSATDLFELYAETKQFANTANEYIPSRTEISNAYKTLKAKLTYFRSFINNNRPSGQNPLQETIIATIRQRRPEPQPPPTQSSNNSPPPPPNNSPDPPPTPSQPTPIPTPSPTISNIYNAITSPSAVVGTVAGLGAGAAFMHQMNIMRNQGQLQRLQGENILNRGRNLAEAGLGQAIGNQLQQATQNTLQNIRNAQQTLQNIENRQQRQTSSAERNPNPNRERPPMRQRTIDTQTRARQREVQVQLGSGLGTVLLDEDIAQQEIARQLGGESINVPQTPEDVRQVMEISRASRGVDTPVSEQDIQTELTRNLLAEQMARQDPDAMNELYGVEPRTLQQRRFDLEEQLDFT